MSASRRGHSLAFASANTVAVLGALYVAFALDFERPYWAMFSVFIVAKPISGAVRSKAVYRLGGTLIGAGGALLMIPPLVHSPPMLCLAMALWVSVWLWLSLMDRTPRSYLPMLAGYTATIVGLSVVNSPEAIFDTAVARVEEIGLGILCAAIAHTLFFPRSAAEELNSRISAYIRTCAGCISRYLADDAPAAPPPHQAASGLSRMLGDLHTLNTHIAFETFGVPRASRTLWALQNRMAMLLPLLSNAKQAIDRLRVDHSLPAPLQAAINSVRQWTDAVARGADPLDQGMTAPRATVDAGGQEVGSQLEASATHHLSRLSATVEEVRMLARALRDPDTTLPPALAELSHTTPRPSLPLDSGMAFLSAGAAFIAVLIASMLWIGGAWPEGAVAVQFVAIGCSMFATLDRPNDRLGAALVGIIVALPIAALYQFAVLPQIDGFASLALVLAPLLLLFSYLQSFEKLEGAGLILAVTFAGGLALQGRYHSDFASFVNINLAEIAGVVIAMILIRLLRTLDPTWNAVRLSRQAWRSLSLQARAGRADAPGGLLQALDREGQVALRLPQLRPETLARYRIDVLRDLRVSLNLATLGSLEKRVDPALARHLAEVRSAVSDQYEAQVHAMPDIDTLDLAVSLSHGIEAFTHEPASEQRSQALAGLIALQLDLTPAGTSQ